MIDTLYQWLSEPAGCALMTVLLAGVFDLLLGEPPSPVHPVVWIGRLIGLLERRRPHGRPRAEFLWGFLVVLVPCGVAGGVAWVAALGVAQLPLWIGVPLMAYLLKTTFSLRGLVSAGRTVQVALDEDTDAARDELRALVSRSRQLEPPQIVSATVESLAENLTDSVLAPLLAFALFGLPGAVLYRVLNTADAMIGYHGEFEYVGKAAARLDDVANWVPARLAGIGLCLVAVMTGRGRRAIAALRRDRKGLESPNAGWTMAPMAGALRVQLEKIGHYRLGLPERALAPAIIGEAISLTWTAGGLYVMMGGLAAAAVRLVR